MVVGLWRVEVTGFNLASLLGPPTTVPSLSLEDFLMGKGGSEKDTEPLLGPSLGIRD